MVTKKVKRGISAFLRNKPGRNRFTMGMARYLSGRQMEREYQKDLDTLSTDDMERKWGNFTPGDRFMSENDDALVTKRDGYYGFSPLDIMMIDRDIDPSSRERIMSMWLSGRSRRDIEALIKSYPMKERDVLQIRAKKSSRAKPKRKTCSCKRK